MFVTPFTDPDRFTSLYATAGRLTRRTGALHAAKTAGEDATATISELAAHVFPAQPVVGDIGCGRGTTTLALTARLQPRRMIALDRSPHPEQVVTEIVRCLAPGSHAVLVTKSADSYH